MARRYTVNDLLEDEDHWDPDLRLKRATRERRRELTPAERKETLDELAEQRKLAEELAADLEKRVEKQLARSRRLTDPVKRAVALDREVQFAAELHSAAVAARNVAVADALDAPRGQGTNLRKLAFLLFLTESRVRQIKVQDHISDPSHVSHNRKVAELLTEDFLRTRYLVEGKSQRAIADEAGCDVGTVSRYMRAYGIPARKGRPRASERAASR